MPSPGARLHLRPCNVLLLAVAVAAVLAVRTMPLWGANPEERPEAHFEAENGDSYRYVVGWDSYAWLRQARNIVRTGHACDEVGADGVCRDTLAYAPVGAPMRYADSLHDDAIAGVHRLALLFDGGYPLEASALWLQALLGAGGVLPAFFLARRAGTAPGGLVAALVVGLSPYLLLRTIRADTDVWNVVLPVWGVWLAVCASRAKAIRSRLAWGVLTAGVIVLHGAVWSGWIFTYAVAAGAMAVILAAEGLLVLRCDGVRAVRETPELRGGVAMVLLVLLVVEVAAHLLDLGGGVSRIAGRVLSPAQAAPPVDVWFPNNFGTVTELDARGVEQVATLVGGRLPLLLSWIGLAAVLAPWGRLLPGAVATLVGVGVLAVLVASGGLVSPGLGVSLILVLLPSLLARVVTRERLDRAATVAVAVSVWFVAGLEVSSMGRRFVILLIPPMGVAWGIMLGAAHRAALRLWDGAVAGGGDRAPEDASGGRVPPRRKKGRQGRRAGARSDFVHSPAARTAGRIVVNALALVVMALVVLGPIRVGWAVGGNMQPRLNDAWAAVLGEIRASTPPETIVNTWWDYGYFVKYLAERRVSADGASLQSRIPHWLGRALLSPGEREMLGWLRMLNCGSDVPGEPEARRGAYSRLRALFPEGITAYAILEELVVRERDEANALLAGYGVTSEARSHVLQSTHCSPPPTVVLLSSEMVKMPAWVKLGGWDVRRAAVWRIAQRMEEEEAVPALSELGYEADTARALYRSAVPRTGQRARDAFISTSDMYLLPAWSGCQWAQGTWFCPLGVRKGGVGYRFFRYDPRRPEQGKIVAEVGGRSVGLEPVTLWLAEADALAERPVGGQGPATLLDLEESRILMGSAPVVRSSFTQLTYLLGRTMPNLELMADARSGAERVLAYRVRWPAGWMADAEAE